MLIVDDRHSPDGAGNELEIPDSGCVALVVEKTGDDTLVDFTAAASLQTAVPASVLLAFEDGGRLLSDHHQKIAAAVRKSISAVH